MENAIEKYNEINFAHITLAKSEKLMTCCVGKGRVNSYLTHC